MNHIPTYFLPFLIVFFFGCENNPEQKNGHERKIPAKNQGDYLPESTGKEFEILIIGKTIKEKQEVLKAIDSVFYSYYPALPQQETWFSTSYLNIDRLNEIHLKHRSILLILPSEEPGRKMKELLDEAFPGQRWEDSWSTMEFNVWAQPQVVTVVHANNPEELVSHIYKGRNSLLEVFDRGETINLKRILYPATWDRSTSQEMMKYLGYKVRIPEGYKKALMLTEPEDSSRLKPLDIRSFAWFRLDTRNTISNIMCYSMPYEGPRMLTKEFILNLRDRVGKKFVDGPNKGSFMQVERRMELDVSKTTISGYDAREIRGLWRIEGDYMGGPFVHYAVRVNDRMIFLDGFVYAAGSDKKPFIKRVEVVLSTLQASTRQDQSPNNP